MRTAVRTVALCSVVLILAGVGLSIAAANWPNVISAVFYVSFPSVAWVIVRAQRATAVATCFAVSALLYGIQKVGDDLTVLGQRHDWPSGLVRFAVWCSNWTWFPGLFLLVTVMVLRFPTGRLLSPRWRWVEWTSVLAMAVWAVGISAAATAVPVDVLITSVEPLPAGGLARVVFVASEPAFPVLAVCTVLSFTSLVLRHHRSGPVERAQIRWVLAAAGVAVVIELSLTLHGFFVGHTPFWLENLGEGVGFGLIAVATGVAVTRYRLYEIDRIVSRTVTYSAVLLVLGGLYVGVLAGLAAVLPSGVGPLRVAAATLAVTVLAVPLTRRVRRVVDRRFHRSRFDAERVVTDFAARLRAQPDRGDVGLELLAVLDRTVQPVHAGVWVVRR